MIISLITAWLSVFFALMACMKYIARISGVKAINRFFAKIHIPFGRLLMFTALLHGVLAGNEYGASLGELRLAGTLFTVNAGTICFVLAILLWASFRMRKQLKRAWMPVHRILTVLMLCTLLFHLAEVGISLPARLAGTPEAQEPAMEEPAAPEPTDAAETVTDTPAAPLKEDEAAPEAPVTEPEAEAADTPEAEPVPGETTDAPDTQEPIEPGEAPDEADKTDTDPDSEPAEPDDGLAELIPAEFSGAKLKDGTYTGSGKGYKGDITVEVTVEGGSVTNIEIVSERETRKYFSRALQLIDAILNGQTLVVDGISGATRSSNGIRNAVYNALTEAVVEGELAMP